VAKKQKNLNFEGALEELEALVEKMEDGNISLEESLKYFERGIALTRTCQKALAEAEQKVQILLEKNGEQQLQPFSTKDNNE
jgi:exodeoxyribonuclease VII small subunit